MGYVGTSLIFSSSLAALVCGTIDKIWAAHIKEWILISWIFLSIGILLGSIWAYYELGWGGFWFWDPVENISLMPWLCLTALIHSIIVLEKRSLLASWTLILSITSFTLSMCGTFLVRSGILNSVHTFANDPKRGIFILIFLFVLILGSLFIFFVLYKPKMEEQKNFLFSKETSILLNNWFMMYFLSVVLIGTVYPIFMDWFDINGFFAFLIIVHILIGIFGIYRMNVRKVVENPDSTFTPIPATITPAGLELDPDTPENLDNAQK